MVHLMDGKTWPLPNSFQLGPKLGSREQQQPASSGSGLPSPRRPGPGSRVAARTVQTFKMLRIEKIAGRAAGAKHLLRITRGPV